jgi:hypothetical protein
MSFKERAVLVSLTVSKPRLTKKDNKATVDAELANNARGAGRYVKDLYPKHLIDPIIQVENDARAYMYGLTLPWNKGQHLLPCVRFMEFAERMGKFELAFGQAVTAFLNNYSNVLTQAQETQGSLFNAEEYPDLSELRAQFSLNVRYFPVADAGDFRVQVAEDVLARLKSDAEAQIRESLADTMREPYQRLYEAVARIYTQCSKEDGRIYDTLMDNLDHLLDVLPDLNFVGDTRLDELIEDCRSRIAVHPDMLRVEKEKRRDVAAEAKAILEKMAGFMA